MAGSDLLFGKGLVVQIDNTTERSRDGSVSRTVDDVREEVVEVPNRAGVSWCQLVSVDVVGGGAKAGTSKAAMELLTAAAMSEL